MPSLADLIALQEAIEDGAAVDFGGLNVALVRDLLRSAAIARPKLMPFLRELVATREGIQEVADADDAEYACLMGASGLGSDVTAEHAIFADDPIALMAEIDGQRIAADARLMKPWCGSRFLADRPTLIQFAAICGAERVAKLLFALADPSIPDAKGRSLRQFAVAGGSASIIALSPPAPEERLWRARLRHHRREVVSESDLKRRGAAHEAAIGGNLAALSGAVGQIDSVDSAGETPLALAVTNRQLCACVALLELGANPNIGNRAKRTPLHMACEAGLVDFVRELLACPRTALTLTDGRGRQAIHVAAAAGRVECVKVLLDRVGADTVTDYGETLLHIAVGAGQAALVEFLLALPGFQAGAETVEGESALHVAARAGLSKFPMLLGRIDPNVRDSKGWTPLHYAVVTGDEEGVGLLLSAGARINDRSKSGVSALFLAVRGQFASIVDRLLGAGADVDMSDRDGWGAIHVAAKAGDAELVERLLGAGADVNCQDEWGWTPLHNAVRYRHLDVAEALLQAPGLDINRRNASGATVLHFAALNHDRALSRTLAARPEADTDAKDGEGRTPADLAKIPIFRLTPQSDPVPGGEEEDAFEAVGRRNVDYFGLIPEDEDC